MSRPMRKSDPAYWMLEDGVTSSTTVYDPKCYICADAEFGQMGLPLCRECWVCKEKGTGLGHIPADDNICTVCGASEYDSPAYQKWLEERSS